MLNKWYTNTICPKNKPNLLDHIVRHNLNIELKQTFFKCSINRGGHSHKTQQ